MAKHFLPLDGLRGLAILLVVLAHTFEYVGPSRPGRFLAEFAKAGWVGVDLFFVLSGFLITGILLDTRGRKHYLRDFYARRSLRIFPLYFGFLAAYFFAAPHWPAAADRLPQPAEGLRVYYWTYTANMREWLAGPAAGVPPLDPLWSLAVEEQVYLFLPLVVLLVPRRHLLGVFAAAAVASLAWRFLTRLTAQSVELSYAWAPANAEFFAAGGIVALLSRDRPDALRRWAPRVGSAALCFLAGQAIGQGHFNFWKAPVEVLTAGMTGLSCLFAAAIGIAVTSDLRSPFNRLLSAGWLRSFGKYSYAIYIFHGSIIALIVPELFSPRTGLVRKADPFCELLLVAVILSVSYAAARISWVALERPFLRLKALFPTSGTVVLPGPAAGPRTSGVPEFPSSPPAQG